jgi:hypothetical protein
VVVRTANGESNNRRCGVAQALWARIDAGKLEHHCVVIDSAGQRVLSERVANDERALLRLIAAVSELAQRICTTGHICRRSRCGH